VYRNLNYEQQNAANRALIAPTVMHKIRLSMMAKRRSRQRRLYRESRPTAGANPDDLHRDGGRSDIDLAPAVDVTVKRRETELKRTPNALRWRDEYDTRVDVADASRFVVSRRAHHARTGAAVAWNGGQRGGKRRHSETGLGDESEGQHRRSAWANTIPAVAGPQRTFCGELENQVPAKGQKEIPTATTISCGSSFVGA
jgi:hypothetical protein